MASDEADRTRAIAAGIALCEDIAEVQYPCLVLDVGSSRLPHHFDAVPFEDLRSVTVSEVIITVVTGPDWNWEDLDVVAWDLSREGNDTHMIEVLGEFLQDCTFVSYNAVTDLWLLRLVDHRCGGGQLPTIVRAFCPMRYGTRFSTCRIYQGGEKVLKWPHLSNLYHALTGAWPEKGGILHDLSLCLEVFRIMQERRGCELADGALD